VSEWHRVESDRRSNGKRKRVREWKKGWRSDRESKRQFKTSASVNKELCVNIALLNVTSVNIQKINGLGKDDMLKVTC
jgi:hypothetical protein